MRCYEKLNRWSEIIETIHSSTENDTSTLWTDPWEVCILFCSPNQNELQIANITCKSKEFYLPLYVGAMEQGLCTVQSESPLRIDAMAEMKDFIAVCKRLGRYDEFTRMFPTGRITTANFRVTMLEFPLTHNFHTLKAIALVDILSSQIEAALATIDVGYRELIEIVNACAGNARNYRINQINQLTKVGNLRVC